MPLTARPARRASLLAFVCTALLLLVAPAANAAKLSFTAERMSATSATFSVTGVDADQVRNAQIRIGQHGIAVPVAKIRRAATTGTLQVRLPRSVARKLSQGRISRRARRAGWPKLTVVLSRPAKPVSRPVAAPVSQPASKPVSRPTTSSAPTTPSAPASPAPSTPPASSPSPSYTRGTPVAESTSGFETGNFSEFTSLQNKFGSLAVTNNRAYEGSRSARATWAGGPQGAQRVWKNTDWNTGNEVWYGMAVYVPANTEYCYWNPMRWDNYDLYGGVDDDLPGTGDLGGLTVEQGRIYVMKGTYGGAEHKLVDGGALAKGGWTWIEVHQKFSGRDGEALSELYINGQKRGASTKANTNGRKITDLRAGVVNVASECSTPNAIDFDRVTIANEQRGPLS